MTEMDSPRPPAAGPWPAWKIALWALLAFLAILVWGPGFIRSFRPAPNEIVDFFQEWVSARFHFEGQPLYSRQEVALERYLGFRRTPDQIFNEVNAHPPVAVLVTLPLGRLSYPDACLVWNLISLAAGALGVWLIVRQLRLSFSPWAVLPLVALLLICRPLREQIVYGQLNLVLLALIVGGWAAGRSGRDWLAGGLMGTAAAIKMFPAFLFLYFLVRGRWRVLAGGALVGALWTGLAAVVLGTEALKDYAFNVVPYLSQTYRDSWLNLSLTGYWHKLFAGSDTGGHTHSLWHAPRLAAVLAATTCLAVSALAAWAALRARSQAECDRAFVLTILAMLLVSPITWGHYLLLLLLPIVLLWQRVPRWSVSRALLWVCVTLVWVNPVGMSWGYLFPGIPYARWFVPVAQPWQVLTVLSLHTYVLLLLFAMGALTLHDQERKPVASTRLVP